MSLELTLPDYSELGTSSIYDKRDNLTNFSYII